MRRYWPIPRYQLQDLRGWTEENRNESSVRIVGDDVAKVYSRDSIVGLEDAGFKSRHKRCCLLQIIHTCCRAHPVSYSMGTGFRSREYSGRDVKLTTHL
jgi:hypothetical protein